jgi:hypothetical protein
MRLAFGLMLLLLGSTLSGQPSQPIYPRDFAVRGCNVTDGREPSHPDEHCANCDWIRTDEGWIVSCSDRSAESR